MATDSSATGSGDVVVPFNTAQYVVINAVVFSVAVCFVLLRLYVRISMIHYLGLDDALIIAALILGIGPIVCVELMFHYGLGHDIAFSSSKLYLKLLISLAATYAIVMLLVKVSLLLLYRRLFSSASKAYSIYWWFTLVLCIGYGVPAALLSVFGCLPFAATYDKSIADAKCINLTALFTAQSALNALSDWLILALPLLVVWRLNLDRREKVVLSVIFCFGSLTCCISLYRLSIPISGRHQPMSDMVMLTHRAVITHTWSLTEMSCAFICASIITFRPLVQPYLGKFLTPHPRPVLLIEYPSTVRTLPRAMSASRQWESDERIRALMGK